MTSNPQKFRVFFGDPDLPQMFMMFLPIFLDRILNSFIATVHSYFVADAGDAVISAISLAGQVNSTLTAVFFCVCSAVIVVIAQLVGSGNTEKASLTVGHSLTFALYGVSVIGLVFIIFPDWIMMLFFGEVDSSILNESIKYIRLLGIYLPFEVIFQTCACACRGFNEHRIPMFVSVSGSIVKVVFSFFLIKIFKLGIVGAGISLIIGAMYSAIVAYIVLYRRKWVPSIKNCLRINFALIKNVLYLGVFSSTEQFASTFAGTIKTGYLVPFGTVHITASSVYSTFGGLLDTIPFTMTTLVRNYVAIGIGSKNLTRTHHMIWKCYIYNLTLSTIVRIIAFITLPYLYPLYTQNTETLAIIGVVLLINTIATPLISIFTVTIRAALDGAGDAKFATVVTLICLVVFDLGLGYILTVRCGLGLIGATWSSVASAFVKAIVYFIRYKSGKWKNHVMV